jgi:N-acetylneuraminate synthase
MPLGIKLGTREEIIAIFESQTLYTCFGVYELPASKIDGDTLQLLKSAGDKGVRFTVHAPHPFNSDVDIASADDGIRDQAVDLVKEAINVAGYFSAEVVVVHCGLTNNYIEVVERRGLTSKRTRKDALQAARESLSELYPHSKNAGVCLTIENDAALPGIQADSNETRSNVGVLGTTPDEMAFLLDGFEASGLTFDIGHAYGTANYLRRNPYDFMKSIINSVGMERIKNVHLTDIIGSVDYHVAVGDGGIDFSRVLPLFQEYDGPLIVENFPIDLYKSIERIRPLYSSLLDRQNNFDLIDVKEFCVKMGWNV